MEPHFPVALTVVAIVSLAVAGACAVAIAIDVIRRPSRMAVMRLVWPVVALFGGVPWLVLYARYGRAPRRGDDDARRPTPRWASIAVSTSHCGAGCSLGDLVAESLLAALPALAVVGGLGWLFTDRLFAVWVIDFVLAFGIGIALQYAAIAPHRDGSRGSTLLAAVKADTASITAWQVGMFGLMAIAQFLVFPAIAGGRAGAADPEFWFAMQLAMLAGFAVAYPVNALLISRGVKEAM
ncbi:MAG: DUF4396 domain-containing protein [Actinomycetales bacterium]|nr:DUF4396 domain-containing protein [Actinomycetales bacterium]